MSAISSGVSSGMGPRMTKPLECSSMSLREVVLGCALPSGLDTAPAARVAAGGERTEEGAGTA